MADNLTSRSPQEEKEAGTVVPQPSESGPANHVPAEETGVTSPEQGTKSLADALSKDQLDHPKPEAAAEPAATPPTTAQKETQTSASPASSNQLAPRTSAPLQTRSAEESKNRALAAGHPDLLAYMAYVSLSNKLCPAQEDLAKAASLAILSFQEQMHPKDALDGLAMTQILLTHGRLAYLTKLAANQKDPKTFAMLNEACERATGTFVRLMRAIDEYRHPTNAGTAISIGQANLAQQQVVQNIQEVKQEKNVDERTRMRGSGKSAGAETLSAIGEGVAVPADHHLANSAVDEEHRPQKPGGKGANQHERPKTRRTVRRQRRAPETDEGDAKGTGASD